MTQTPPKSNSHQESNQPVKDGAPTSAPPEETTFLGYLRDWADALVIAFVVAMFIRMFVVELFKIPSGSMSPTLLGDWVAEGVASDRQGQSHHFLLIMDPSEIVQVFERQNDGYYDYQGKHPRFALTASQQVLLQSKLHREEHRILVNKFAYWFKQPERGDIVIFRVPFKSEPYMYSRNGVDIPGRPYNRNESVYVKRAVAFAGEEVAIKPDQHIYINGNKVTDPVVMSRLQYIIPGDSSEYDIKVPKEHLVVLGDNSDNSLDSRYWGPLPENNLRGKAVLRYWPFKDKWFLSPK
jgi:signal peptidase I